MKQSLKQTAGAVLACSVLLTPVLAFADGSIQLKPLQDTNVYSSGYTNTNASTGLPNYGNSYYTPDTSNNNSNYYLHGRVVSIPKGTLMTISTNQPISSVGTRLGDTVISTLESDVYVNDVVAIPAGSQVLGQVANVVNAGHVGKHGTLDIRFDSVKFADGRTVPIRGHIVTKDESGILKGDSFGMDVAKGVGVAAGGTAVGTLMGTAAGSLMGSVGTGALFGLGVGAVGGMGYALARKGKDVILPSGSRMSVMIDMPVTVSN